MFQFARYRGRETIVSRTVTAARPRILATITRVNCNHQVTARLLKGPHLLDRGSGQSRGPGVRVNQVDYEAVAGGSARTGHKTFSPDRGGKIQHDPQIAIVLGTGANTADAAFHGGYRDFVPIDAGGPNNRTPLISTGAALAQPTQISPSRSVA